MPDKLTKQEFKDKLLKAQVERKRQGVRDYYGYTHDSYWRMKRLYRKENLRSQKCNIKA
jgi:hypothetical protein